MPGLLYFVAGAKAPATRQRIYEWGLSHAFDSVPMHLECTGPEDQAGVLLGDAPRLDPLDVKYRPERQTWRKIPGTNSWVGVYDEARPGEADLRRDELLEGEAVELADGRPWLVPRVRQVFRDGHMLPALPAYLDIDERGQPKQGDVLAKYLPLWDAALPFWEAWHAAWSGTSDQAGETYVVECPTQFQDAAKVLSGNYRIGPAEIALLRLFRTDGTPAAVLYAACDCRMAEYFSVKKKRESCPKASSAT